MTKIKLVRRGTQVAFLSAETERGSVGIEVKVGGLGTEEAMQAVLDLLTGKAVGVNADGSVRID